MNDSNPHAHVLVEANELYNFAYELAQAAGACEENAKAIAQSYLHADLSGYGLQGIDYIPYLLDQMLDGRVNGQALPNIKRDYGATTLIDGRLGPGQTAAIKATEVAIEKAKEFGVGAVGITNSSDIFMLGYYVYRIATADLIGMGFTAGPPLVHAFGGVEKVLGTNPLAMSFPNGESPFVFDMATSALARSRIRHAYYHNEKVPEGIGLNSNGEPTTIAEEIYKGGMLSPLAGHKGFGLSALCRHALRSFNGKCHWT